MFGSLLDSPKIIIPGYVRQERYTWQVLRVHEQVLLGERKILEIEGILRVAYPDCMLIRPGESHAVREFSLDENADCEVG